MHVFINTEVELFKIIARYLILITKTLTQGKFLM